VDLPLADRASSTTLWRRHPLLSRKKVGCDFPVWHARLSRAAFTARPTAFGYGASEEAGIHDDQDPGIVVHERAARREINLETVAQVVSDARQNGLLVYFGVPMEQAPAWFWRRYPDASMVYETGQPHNDPTQYLLPADAKPGPCWHHPGARWGTKPLDSFSTRPLIPLRRLFPCTLSVP
jgi:hypothetical protein